MFCLQNLSVAIIAVPVYPFQIMRVFRFFRWSLLILLAFSACNSRVPSPKTAQSVAEGYYKRYGSKYKTSPFAHKNLERVTINQIEEISYRNVQVDAFANYKSGQTQRVLIKMENKLPGGWRVDSWEFLE